MAKKGKGKDKSKGKSALGVVSLTSKTAGNRYSLKFRARVGPGEEEIRGSWEWRFFDDELLDVFVELFEPVVEQYDGFSVDTPNRMWHVIDQLFSAGKKLTAELNQRFPEISEPVEEAEED